MIQKYGEDWKELYGSRASSLNRENLRTIIGNTAISMNEGMYEVKV